MLNSLKKYFRKRFDRFYKPNRWHLVIDIILAGVILILSGLLIFTRLYKPVITFPAFKAPEKVIIDLENPSVELNIKFENEAIKNNETLFGRLILINKSSLKISDLELIFNSKNKNIEILNIEFPASYENDYSAINEGDKLIIKELAPSQKVEADLRIAFRNPSSLKELDWELDYSYIYSNQEFKNSIQLPIIKFISNLKAQGTAYYNSPQGDQLGSGPFPPTVDLPTNIWIFFKAQPDGDFEDFTMSAKLPNNVSFTENTSMLAGNLIYNPDTRQVIWQIPKLQKDVKDYRVGFEVQLIPTKEQIGRDAVLVNNIKYRGLDSFTGLVVEGIENRIDTSLEHDLINKGDGKVIE